MKQLTSLAWKEWREVQAFFWVAIFVFLGLPIIGGLEALAQNYARQFNLEASPWVYVFGGVLAVFVAAGTSCRDFHGRLEDFWRSRPVSVNRWLAVKYLVGLAVVVVACWLPLIIEGIVNDHDNRVEVRQLFGMDVGWMPLFWSALYSLAFLAGCLVRRTSHAATLGLAAMLLVYVIPQLVPPLHWMGMSDRRDDNPTAFVAGMLIITLGAATLAVIAVRRGWHIESGRKTLYGLIVAAILILCISANYQLGTNLPVLQRFDLPEKDFLIAFEMKGNRGAFVTFPDGRTYVHAHNRMAPDYFFYKLEIDQAGFQITDSRPFYYIQHSQPQWTAPSAEYSAGEYIDENGVYNAELYIRNGRNLGHWAMDDDKKITLWQRKALPGEKGRHAVVQEWQNRLYILGSRLVTLDISKPFSPNILSIAPFTYEFAKDAFDGGDRIFLNLPSVPDLPREAKLRAVINALSRRTHYLSLSDSVFDGKTLCVVIGAGSLFEYRLTSLTENGATFEKVGEYKPSPIERLFGAKNLEIIEMTNGLVYARTYSGSFNMRMIVFDTRSGAGLKEVAHFSAPYIGFVDPLPDGRVIVAGSSIWMLSPPAIRSKNLTN